MVPPSDVEDLEVRLLISAIHQRYGYDFRGYEPASIGRRVRAALGKSGAAHLGELQHRVLTSPEQFAALVDDLTVQVSELFRDAPVYAAFRREVCPVLRTYPQIKIWHAGCASGEEIYTTAILLKEEGLYDRTQIYATDISATALQRAREGVYDARAAERADEAYAATGGSGTLRDYYSIAYGKVAMHPSLRRNVVFFQHDLVSDYSLGEMQVVFCRNVLIYFGRPLQERVLSMLTAGLCRGGFLCLGTSEVVPPALAQGFQEISPPQRIYKHRGQG